MMRWTESLTAPSSFFRPQFPLRRPVSTKFPRAVQSTRSYVPWWSKRQRLQTSSCFSDCLVLLSFLRLLSLPSQTSSSSLTRRTCRSPTRPKSWSRSRPRWWWTEGRLWQRRQSSSLTGWIAPYENACPRLACEGRLTSKSIQCIRPTPRPPRRPPVLRRSRPHFNHHLRR